MNDSILPREQLTEGAKELGLELPEEQMEKLNRFVALLLDWNQRMNLTRITDPSEIVIKHLLDSFSCLRAFDFPQGAKVIDVGTGAGLPGIPLKVARPDISITLLDATRKKLTFIEAVVQELGLENVKLVHGRAEDVAVDPKMRESFDVVVARAVGDMRPLVEYCIPFAKVGGTVLIQKGPEVDEELAKSKNGIKTLGAQTKDVVKLVLPGSDLHRSLVVISKKAPTPSKYPRRQAEIAKKPL